MTRTYGPHDPASGPREVVTLLRPSRVLRPVEQLRTIPAAILTQRAALNTIAARRSRP